MSTAVMTERIAEASPGFEASGFRASSFRMRIACVVSLLGVLGAALAEIFVRGRLTVVGGLVVALAMIAVTLLFYDILRPLNRRISLLAMFFNLAGLASQLLRLQPRGVNIAVVFDAFFCILIGFAVFRSSFRPRILGALMALGGLGWLTLLSPPLTNYLSPYNLAIGLAGEGSVCLWVLLTGTNVER